MNIRRACVTSLLIASFGLGLHAQTSPPLTTAQLVAKVTALEQEVARLTALCGAPCVASPAVAPPAAASLSGIAAASAAAANVHHDWPRSTNLGSPAAPPLTAAEMADINRSTFDKVYAAGKAVAEARFLSAVGVSPRQFQQLLLTFNTELSVAWDRVATKADKALAAKYQLAYVKFELGASQLDSSLRATWTKGLETMSDAAATLNAANAIYLGK
jgi:hypothetical protein